MKIEGVSSIKPQQDQVMQKASEQDKFVQEESKKSNLKNQNQQIKPENKMKELKEDELIHFIEEANKDFLLSDRKFEFSIHEETKAIMVKVINAGTDEIIREIPPEKILDMVAKMWEMAGIFVDEKV